MKTTRFIMMLASGAAVVALGATSALANNGYVPDGVGTIITDGAQPNPGGDIPTGNLPDSRTNDGVPDGAPGSTAGSGGSPGGDITGGASIPWPGPREWPPIIDWGSLTPNRPNCGVGTGRPGTDWNPGIDGGTFGPPDCTPDNPGGGGFDCPPPDHNCPPDTDYGPPNTNFGPPNTNFGPPNTNCGPPSTGYGPPSTGYGPPSQWQYRYGKQWQKQYGKSRPPQQPPLPPPPPPQQQQQQQQQQRRPLLFN